MMKLISGTTGKTITLQPGQSCSLGSGSASDLRIDDPKVSPIHSRVTFRGNFGFIESIDPSNQFLINQRASDRASLVNGDELRIGTNMISVRVQLDGEINPIRKSDNDAGSSLGQRTDAQTNHNITTPDKFTETSSAITSQDFGDTWEQVQTPTEFDSVGIDGTTSDFFDESVTPKRHTFDDENDSKNNTIVGASAPASNPVDETNPREEPISPVVEQHDSSSQPEQEEGELEGSKNPATRTDDNTPKEFTASSNEPSQEEENLANTVSLDVETVYVEEDDVQSKDDGSSEFQPVEAVDENDQVAEVAFLESGFADEKPQVPIGDEPDYKSKSENIFDLKSLQEANPVSESSAGENEEILEIDFYQSDNDHPVRSGQDLEDGDNDPDEVVELADTESVAVPNLKTISKRTDKLFLKFTGKAAMAALQDDSNLAGCFLVNSIGVKEMSLAEIEDFQSEHQGGFVVLVSELANPAMQETTIRLRLNRRFQFPVAAELFFRSPPSPIRRFFQTVTGCFLFFDDGQMVYFQNAEQTEAG